MAEGESFQSEFSKALDCMICMDRLQDPKALSCHHTFCKNCLDGMIKFRFDGSGQITCPMRCEILTEIGTEKTTNDLIVPYQLKSILDVYNKQSIRYHDSLKKLECLGETGCSNGATLYCRSCEILLCNLCHPAHNDKKHVDSSFHSVQYDTQHEQTKLLCKRHNTLVNFYCCETAICIYCKERDHKLHSVETMKEQVSKIREVLTHSEYGVGKIEDLVENTFRNAEATELSVSVLRSMLQKSLNRRKQSCLYDYLKLLRREEKRLMDEFNKTVDEHMLLYPKTRPTRIYDDILQKDDFEIVLHKTSLVGHVTDFTRSIPTSTIGLTAPTSSYPLGNMKVGSNGHKAISERKTVASISISLPEGRGTEIDDSPLEKLKSLLQEVLPDAWQNDNTQRPDSYNEKYAQKDCTEGSKLPDIDAKKLEDALSEVKKRGIDYIRDLCKYKEEDLLLAMLPLCPAVISQTNLIGNSALHFAALNGCLRVLSRLLSNVPRDEIDAVNRLGSTPLHYAVENCHASCVKELLSWKCNLNIKNGAHYTALDVAKQYKYSEIVDLLGNNQQ